MTARQTRGHVGNAEVREFREHNPVAAEGIDATPGTPEFYARFDDIREAEDCEPYAYSDMIHGYSCSAGQRVLDVGCGNGYVLSRYAALDTAGLPLSPATFAQVTVVRVR